MAIAAATSLLPGPAIAAPEAASGPWHVVYENERCVASREYGTEPTRRILVLKPSPSSGVMQIFFFGPGKGQPEQRPGKLQIGSGRSLPVSALLYGQPDTGKLVALVNLPMAEFKTRSNADSIALASGKTSYDLATPGLAKVMDALEKCQADLHQFWNIAPEKASLVAEPAVPDRPLHGYYSERDYPSVALWRQQGGSVELGLLIDESGRIAECAIESTSRIASLDANSCAIMRERAKFAPARDQAGKPVRSHMVVPITWKINEPFP